MKTFRYCTKSLNCLIIISVLLFSVQPPVAHAVLIGTEAVIDAARVQQDRQRLREALNRDDVQAWLVARGVDPAQVRARADSLTDREIQNLAAEADQMPAGGHFFDSTFGDLLGVGVFVFLVLLVTDILGLTNVYPFVKHPARGN